MKKFTNLDDFGVSDKKSFFQTFEAPNVMELEEQLANFEKSNNCTEINRSAHLPQPALMATLEYM